MTTTVKILVEGNKTCEVKIANGPPSDMPKTVKPGQFVTMMIYGEQVLEVKEAVGDFLT